MGEGLRIHLFGEPHFEHRGAAHAFAAPPKTLPLLAFLLLHRNAPVARETIATALWPESDREESLANLRRHLHYLNKALPQDASQVPWISASTRAVCWNVSAPYWLDVEVFEAQSQDRQYRAHAVRLYSGDLYERCADDWMFFERERLRSLQMSNLALLAADARARKAYLQALQYAQLMLALDPWREDALRSVLEIRGLLGDTAGALAEYERFAARLNAELGVGPSEETAQIYARLRRSGARGTAHGSETADETQPLAGRKNELAMLADEWQRARQGRSHLFLIGGEAGVGKSTLLEALAGIARNDDAQVLRGAAATDMPYQAFVDVLRHLPDATPTLHDIANRQPASSDDRLQFFDAIAQVLERAAARPTLVLLEDLHLAGAATLDLLRYLLGRLRDSPVLFAASYREHEIDRSHPLRAIRRQLARSGELSHLAVTPLDRQSAYDLLRSRASRPLTDESMNHIYEAADGNPLFMIEALHQLAQGDFERLPASVATMVHARLDSLNAQARMVAETAAVAGRQCTVELVAQTAGMREGEALRAFDELTERHIVRECMRTEPGEFTFVHDIVRQAVYEHIPAQARRRKHARLGRVLQELHARDLPEHAGVLARHFEQGGLHDEATQMYACAAEAALRLYALEEAQYCALKVRDLSGDPSAQARALFIIDSVARSRGARAERTDALQALGPIVAALAPGLQAEFWFRRAELLAVTNDPRAEEALEQLRAAAGGDACLHARFLLLRGEYLHQHGKHDEAMAELREAQRLFEEAGDVQSALACYPTWLAASISSGELGPEVIERITHAEDLTDPRTAALTASARSSALYNYDPSGGYAAAEDMLHAARQAGDRGLEALAQRKLGNHAAQLNRLSTSESHLRLSAELTLASGHPYNIAAIRVDQMQVANRASHYKAAYEFYEEAFAAARACGSLDLQVRAQVYRCDADVLAGNFESAFENVRPLLEKAECAGLGGILPGIIYLLGTLQVGLESPVRGIDTILRARKIYSRFRINHANYPAILGLAYLCAGDVPRAQECARDLRDQKADVARLFYWPQASLWAAAQLFHFLGRGEDALEFAQAAYERYGEMLAGLHEGPMRDAFLIYRFNRAIVALHERGAWAGDPLKTWFSDWNVGDLSADDPPNRILAPHDEKPKPRAQR